jgi:hypothetical protein
LHTEALQKSMRAMIGYCQTPVALVIPKRAFAEGRLRGISTHSEHQQATAQ